MGKAKDDVKGKNESLAIRIAERIGVYTDPNVSRQELIKCIEEAIDQHN